METTQKTALILGASGLTGSFCLQNLLESECYGSITALVRTTIDIKHPKLKQVVVDFDLTAPMEKHYRGVDDVFCCLGTTIKNAGSQSAFRRVDFHIPTEAANMAAENGVKQFLAISCVGANNRSSNFYLRVKGEMEKGIGQFAFKSIHIFRPSLILGDRDEPRAGESLAKFFGKILSPFLSLGSAKYKPTDASGIAKAMVNAAQLNRDGECLYSSSQILKLSVRKVPCQAISTMGSEKKRFVAAHDQAV
jgi:uncharacterized protein YbjT (DUF2867 family)